MYVYARAGFLLLCMTTFGSRAIENLRVHKLTLPHENLKFKTIKVCAVLLVSPLILPCKKRQIRFYLPRQNTISCSGVARAFPGGRLAHPEGQNEEENK